MEAAIEDNRTRIFRLLEALENGKLTADDVSPRVSELKSIIKALELKRDKIITTKKNEIPTIDLVQVKTYVADLRQLLSESEVVQRKGFLKSFIKRIEMKFPKVKIEYTVPLKPEEFSPSEEVLSFDAFNWE